jgi:hypothetical protein
MRGAHARGVRIKVGKEVREVWKWSCWSVMEHWMQCLRSAERVALSLCRNADPAVREQRRVAFVAATFV